MFDDLRSAFDALLKGNVAPGDRRALLHEMRDTLVRAKLAKEDLLETVAATASRLDREHSELQTVQRRRALAEGIKDAETVAIAARFEGHHLERVAILEKKLDAAQSELALLERDVAEMSTQFKAAQAGVGGGMRAGTVDDELDLGTRDASLDRDMGALDRKQRKANTEAEADARLAELKRRMGR